MRASSVRLLDHDYPITKADEADLTWGMKSQWRADVRLCSANPAHTVTDILDMPKLGGRMCHGAEILAAYLESHRPTTSLQYGDRVGNRTVFKRLGYCIEALGMNAPDGVQACHYRIRPGSHRSIPTAPRTAASWLGETCGSTRPLP